MRIGNGWFVLAGAAGITAGLRRALPRFSFAGKTVLVTGATGGLGQAATRALAGRDASPSGARSKSKPDPPRPSPRGAAWARSA